MLVFAHSFPDNLVWNFPLEIHKKLQHMIIRLSSEHDFAGVKLVEGRPGAPEVDAEVVLHAEDDLRRPVEPRHQVGRDV